LTPSTSTSIELDARRTRLAEGGATLLSSHAEQSPTGDERHSERWSGPTADSLNESQLAAGRGAFTSRPTSPTPRITTASLQGAVPVRPAPSPTAPRRTCTARPRVTSSQRFAPRSQVQGRRTTRSPVRPADPVPLKAGTAQCLPSGWRGRTRIGRHGSALGQSVWRGPAGGTCARRTFILCNGSRRPASPVRRRSVSDPPRHSASTGCCPGSPPSERSRL
jgi:hypothetical protein